LSSAANNKGAVSPGDPRHRQQYLRQHALHRGAVGHQDDRLSARRAERGRGFPQGARYRAQPVLVIRTITGIVLIASAIAPAKPEKWPIGMTIAADTNRPKMIDGAPCLSPKSLFGLSVGRVRGAVGQRSRRFILRAILP